MLTSAPRTEPGANTEPLAQNVPLYIRILNTDSDNFAEGSLQSSIVNDIGPIHYLLLRSLGEELVRHELAMIGEYGLHLQFSHLFRLHYTPRKVPGVTCLVHLSSRI